MLNVQTMIGSVEGDLRNGSNQSRYQGYTTGAHRSDAAIGQANEAPEGSREVLLIQIPERNPTTSGNPAAIRDTSRSKMSKTGSLNRKVCTYVTNEPIGIRPCPRNGTYRSPTKTVAKAASRRRTRFQYRGNNTIGSGFTASANPNVTVAILVDRRSRKAKNPSRSGAQKI